MKCIGHVSTAVIAAAPVIAYRSHLARIGVDPVLELSDFHLLWWVGVFAVAPDLDIILSRFTPIQHRGFASHSIWTALVAGGLVLTGWYFAHVDLSYALEHREIAMRLLPARPWLFPLTAFLAFLAVFIHLLGDSLTKTGVPLLWPKQAFHFPVIGGYAAFDNYFLNAIPLALATWMIIAVFGCDPGALRGFGRFRDITDGLLARLMPEQHLFRKCLP